MVRYNQGGFFEVQILYLFNLNLIELIKDQNGENVGLDKCS